MTKRPIINQLEEDAALMRMIHILRADDGDGVEILCDNPEPASEDLSNAVVCSGYWTDWEERRFSGRSLRAALEAAVQAKAVS